MLIAFLLITFITITTAQRRRRSPCETYLSQSDFDYGTYRITAAGYYCLYEDISFSPFLSECPSRSEPNAGGCYFPKNETQWPGSTTFFGGSYALGWFTAITIETDNVTLDLNAHRIEWGLEFYLQQRWGSAIEVSSDPDGGLVPTFNFDPDMDNPSNVVIRNGIIGRSPHWGIHSGNGASNVRIEDIEVVDFEIAGIQFNGFNGLHLENVQVGPSLAEVYQSGLYLFCVSIE